VIRDRDARLTVLFQTHASRLHAYARRHADAATAEDLVAEAFNVALRRLDVVPEDPGEAFAWLVGTVRKLAANQRRKRSTGERYWREAARELWHAPSGITPEDAVADRESSLSALAALSPTEREVLLLTAWEGLPAEQVAVVLGISKNAVGVRLHRARRRLAELLHAVERPASGPASSELLPVTEGMS
jgi:RNA polymerase sigma factor (sigma-70 family)